MKNGFLSPAIPAGKPEPTRAVGPKGPAARGAAQKVGYKPHGPNNLAVSKGATK